MCLWCGGNSGTALLEDYVHKNSGLLTVERWVNILKDAKYLGVQKIVFSGGGEPLLARNKLRLLLAKAKELHLETMVYTNGSLLANVDASLLDSVLGADWLRVSCHAASSEDVYARLVNRSVEKGDLKRVIDGVRKLIHMRDREKSELRVGIGVVLQDVNYTEMPSLVDMCIDLNVDFLDIRVDCVEVSASLSDRQKASMLGDLIQVRESYQSGLIPFSVTFADDLLIAMDKWEDMEIPNPRYCMIPMIRPSIDPFGVVGACDSIGEPFIRAKSPSEYVLGCVEDNNGFIDIMQKASMQRLGARCGYCMPGQIALNAMTQKLMDDAAIGIMPVDQYFNFQT